MIKLKTLLVEQEQENKYPEDAPKHFGGGENIDILGYQTKHFDICRSAVTLYEKLREYDDEKVKELVLITAKDFDHLFEMEKQVVAEEPLDHDPIDHAIELCNTISFKLGRIAEITNHGDEEEDTHFIQMHVGVIIDRAQKQEMTNENLRKCFKKVEVVELLLVVGIDIVQQVKNLVNVVVVKKVTRMQHVYLQIKLENLVKKV